MVIYLENYSNFNVLYTNDMDRIEVWMKTIKELINELNRFPYNAYWNGYEGEDEGITIFDETGGLLGFISSDESKETEIYDNNG